jgi:GNAT superfamily N-acetyltransferase
MTRSKSTPELRAHHYSREAEVSEISIRLATPEDVPTITRHRYQMFVAMGGDPEETRKSVYEVGHDAWLRPKIESGAYIGYLAENEQGEVIAGTGLWLIDWIPGPNAPGGTAGYLCNVFTEEAYRGKGIARRLVQMAIDECHKRKLKRISLHASDAGRPLYASMGFKGTNEMRLQF